MIQHYSSRNHRTPGGKSTIYLVKAAARPLNEKMAIYRAEVLSGSSAAGTQAMAASSEQVSSSSESCF